MEGKSLNLCILRNNIKMKKDMPDKLKIGIITILKVNNYGAELQALALQRKLNILGYDAEIIDYLFYKNKDHKREAVSQPFTRLSLSRKVKEFLYPVKVCISTYSFRKDKKRREEKFDEFHQKHTQLSKKTYCKYSDLYKEAFSYDVYIVGSDQVWNPYSNTSLNPYFLTFAPSQKVKISYASSFGVSTLPEEVKDKYRELLNGLDHLSVRESKGVEIIKEITGRDSVHVLDPTLLLDKKEWDNLSDTLEGIPEKYILLYVLHPSTYITELAKVMSEKYGYKIVRICREAVAEDADSSIINIIDAGPGEFLYLFSHASFVLTNSFHGTAFSVNFEKPFFSVVSSKKNNNSRLESLLNLLHLQDRLVVDGTPIENLKLEPFDYTEASALLTAERAKSVSYLTSSINYSK